MRKPAPGVAPNWSAACRPSVIRANRSSRPLNLIEVIDQAVFVLKRSIDPPNHCRLDPAGADALAGPGRCAQITQALFNLAINARDAMAPGRPAHLRTSQTAPSARPTAAARKYPAIFVQLTVRDHWPGHDSGRSRACV